jgi:hypothetical protein
VSPPDPGQHETRSATYLALWPVDPDASWPAAHAAALDDGEDVAGQRRDLLAAQVIDNGAQVGLLGAHPVNAAALLQPDQHLQDHPGRQATQTDLPTTADRGVHQPPAGLLKAVLGFPRGAQPQLMRFAIQAVRMTALPWTGGHRTTRLSRQRLGRGVGAELLDREAHRALLLQVRPAQARSGREPFPAAADHAASGLSTRTLDRLRVAVDNPSP